MVKRTGKTHFERFTAAVAGGDDERAEALVALLQPTDEAALLEMARLGEGDQRWWALRALARCGSAEALPTLVAGLHDDDAEIRSVAVMALGALHARTAQAVQPALGQMATLLGDDEALVRQAAADGLARCGDDAVNTLAQALESEQAGVRVRAAHALHRIGTMAVAFPLYQHLNDPNPLVRHYAHETLDDLGLLANVLLTR